MIQLERELNAVSKKRKFWKCSYSGYSSLWVDLYSCVGVSQCNGSIVFGEKYVENGIVAWCHYIGVETHLSERKTDGGTSTFHNGGTCLVHRTMHCGALRWSHTSTVGLINIIDCIMLSYDCTDHWDLEKCVGGRGGGHMSKTCLRGKGVK